MKWPRPLFLSKSLSICLACRSSRTWCLSTQALRTRKFPAKDISIRTMQDSYCLSMMAILLPYWRQVSKPSFDFWKADSNLAIFKNVVNHPSLRHLFISCYNPWRPVLPDPGSNLRILNIQHVDAGLECILTLLRNMQHLQRLNVGLYKSSVNEIPLCNFVDELLTSESRHLSMTNLSIFFTNWHN